MSAEPKNGAAWLDFGEPIHARDLERALRDTGLSQRESKRVVSELRRALAELQTWEPVED